MNNWKNRKCFFYNSFEHSHQAISDIYLFTYLHYSVNNLNDLYILDVSRNSTHVINLKIM